MAADWLCDHCQTDHTAASLRPAAKFRAKFLKVPHRKALLLAANPTAHYRNKQSNMSLAGKVAVITGASSGIGYDTALLFAKEGAKVVGAARRLENLNKLKAEIEAAGGEWYVRPPPAAVNLLPPPPSSRATAAQTNPQTTTHHTTHARTHTPPRSSRFFSPCCHSTG